jgi:hypothetical protein
MLTKEEQALIIRQKIDKLEAFKVHILDSDALYREQDPGYPIELTNKNIDLINEEIQVLTNMLKML